jgi:hypothetical protein
VTFVSSSYNILSLDGGGIRGMIPAVVIYQIEKYAYKYGVEEKGYDMPFSVDMNNEKIVHMKDLFDMLAGTSTGSILAGMIMAPANETGFFTSGNANQEHPCTTVADCPAFSIADAIDLYSTQGARLFQSTALSNGSAFGIGCLVMLLIGVPSYLFFRNMFENKK